MKEPYTSNSSGSRLLILKPQKAFLTMLPSLSISNGMVRQLLLESCPLGWDFLTRLAEELSCQLDLRSGL